MTDDDARAELWWSLDEIVLEGARRMLAAAREAEVDAYLTDLADQRDERDRRLVVRNGHAQPRTITTAAGRIEVRHRGSTTDGWTTPASVVGSGRRSCRRGPVKARR